MMENYGKGKRKAQNYGKRKAQNYGKDKGVKGGCIANAGKVSRNRIIFYETNM